MTGVAAMVRGLKRGGANSRYAAIAMRLVIHIEADRTLELEIKGPEHDQPRAQHNGTKRSDLAAKEGYPAPGGWDFRGRQMPPASRPGTWMIRETDAYNGMGGNAHG
jgi:hypothetical protein